jgi:DNA-binding transcriptional LysR family regulator
VERGHRFNGFTPEGFAVLDHAKRILADCDGLRQELASLKGGLTGKLRIGAIPTALPVVSLVTQPFFGRHPAVTIAILSMASQDIQRRLDDYEIDAGITYLDVEPIEPERASITWAEAADVPLILLTPDMQNRRIVDAVFRLIGRVPKAGIETNSILNLATQVASGPWSSIVPRPLIDMFGVPPGALALALDEPAAARTVGLVIADREPASPLARSFFALAPSLNIETALSDIADQRRMTWRDPIL